MLIEFLRCWFYAHQIVLKSAKKSRLPLGADSRSANSGSGNTGHFPAMGIADYADSPEVALIAARVDDRFEADRARSEWHVWREGPLVEVWID